MCRSILDHQMLAYYLFHKIYTWLDCKKQNNFKMVYKSPSPFIHTMPGCASCNNCSRAGWSLVVQLPETSTRNIHYGYSRIPFTNSRAPHSAHSPVTISHTMGSGESLPVSCLLFAASIRDLDISLVKISAEQSIDFGVSTSGNLLSASVLLIDLLYIASTDLTLM